MTRSSLDRRASAVASRKGRDRRTIQKHHACQPARKEISWPRPDQTREPVVGDEQRQTPEGGHGCYEAQPRADERGGG